ncbi:hypothetical protein [Catellatospora sichuanensis]|uniref:hypothetical protein n=1 Tax=Catellatospora sichuanensis TaxID=1969805 RepID=UPI001181E599|nr:hypothetical protein [Catellatospora sichuanensis]
MDSALDKSERARTRLPQAEHVARVHCPISWPEGDRCLNCHEMFPCTAYGWAFDVLVDAGWSPTDVQALDARTGPWS